MVRGGGKAGPSRRKMRRTAFFPVPRGYFISSSLEARRVSFMAWAV